MKNLLFFALIGITVLFLPYGTFAQEEAEEGVGEAAVGYGYGTVVKVDTSKNEITVAEYGWDKDEEEVTVTYSIDPDVELKNVKALEEITPDTYVDIEYVVAEGGKKIAKLISVYSAESTE